MTALAWVLPFQRLKFGLAVSWKERRSEPSWSRRLAWRTKSLSEICSSSLTRPFCNSSRGASASGITVKRQVARLEPTTLPSARTWEAIS